MSEKRDDNLQKALGLAVALGALAVGVAATVANNERTRQLREEMKVRLDDLGRRVDDLSGQAQQRVTDLSLQAQSRVSDLSSQAQRTIEERRPEIEQTIQKSREAVLGGLDKARSVVEQGADKAQEYVQRAGSHGGDNGGDSGGDAGPEEGVADSDGAGEVQYTDEVSDYTGDAGRPSDSTPAEDYDDSADQPAPYLRDVMSQDAEPDTDAGFSVYGTAGASDAAANTGDVAVNTGAASQDAMADVGGTGEARESLSYVEQAQLPAFDQWDQSGAGAGSAGGMDNLGDASLDALRSDDLSTSSRQDAVGAEDMSGGNDFIEQAAEHSGFQLEGTMHSHAENDANASDTSNSTPTSTATGPLYNADESAGASGAGDKGDAGGAGAPEFGGGEDSAASFGTGGADLTMGEPTIPFRGDTLTNNDVDNESPRPGDERTV